MSDERPDESVRGAGPGRDSPHGGTWGAGFGDHLSVGTGWLRFERTPPADAAISGKEGSHEQQGGSPAWCAGLPGLRIMPELSRLVRRAVRRGGQHLCHKEKYYTAEGSRLGLWLAPLMLPAILDRSLSVSWGASLPDRMSSSARGVPPRDRRVRSGGPHA